MAGLTLLAGCSAPTAALGELTGGIYICGGISDRGCPGVTTNGELARPVSGTVVVSASGHTVARVQVREGETYRVGLQPGTYTVSAGSQVPKVRVLFEAGKTTTVNLVDQIP